MVRQKLTAAKFAKSAVHYRNGKPPKICGRCVHFEPPHACEGVEGWIEVHAVCDRYVRAPRSDWYDHPRKG